MNEDDQCRVLHDVVPIFNAVNLFVQIYPDSKHLTCM